MKSMCGEKCRQWMSMTKLRHCLSFEKMLTPCLIQVLFLVGLVFIVLSVIVNLVHGAYYQALLNLVIGPIALRVICEIFILFFKLHDTLSEVKDLAQQNTHYLARLVRSRSRPRRPVQRTEGSTGGNASNPENSNPA